MGRTTLLIIRHPGYVLIALGVALGVFVTAVWLPNLALIVDVVFTGGVTLSQKAGLLVGLLGSISTNFTPVSAFSTVVIAGLFGVYVALLLYYLRKVRGATRSLARISGAGLGGVVSGFLGVGCAACGTFVLSSVLLLLGIGGILSYLPFGGEEFGVLGIGLLLVAIYSLIARIRVPLVC